MKAINRKPLTWGVAVLTTGCWAFSLAAHYTDFFFTSKTEKIAILGSLLILTSLLSAWLFLVVMNSLLKPISGKKAIISLGLSAVVIAAIFSFAYHLPPFPEQHQLKISVMPERNPVSGGSETEIVSLATITLPTQKYKRIPVSQLTLDGNWQGTNGGFGIKTTYGQSTSASFERFMQAGVDVEFRTGPQSGMVQIIWDGDEQTLDLYSSSTGTKSVALKPKLDWLGADMTRKILVAGAFIADFLGLSIIIFALILLIFSFFSGKRISVRNPGLLFLCLTLVGVLWFAALKINKEVAFENPQIESLVRDILKKPKGNISQLQLLTIVKLDASGRNITSLDGIEQMPNLAELDLRSNQISDIAPLSRLKRLKKLNLRNNAVADLTPLTQLTGLTHLNIHSNTKIGLIEPLGSLINLRTLIMAYVPVRDEIQLLKNFKKLKNLNLRGCGVKDLETISHLDKLEHLNLFSNSDISTIKPLKKLTNLHELILANISIGDEIEALASLPKLKYLNLRNTNVSDISPLSQLTGLEYLNLHSNSDIQSIEPLKNMIGLQSLILEDVPVGKQIEILANFHDLRKLNIRNCGITDINVLGSLIAGGAMQDNTKTGVQAEVDIRDNLIPGGAEDRFISVRPYWEKISIRQPFALPFFTELSEVNFSERAGFYDESFELELTTNEPNAHIYYTLDSSEPTTNSSVYSKPILIVSKTGEPNKYSAIEAVAADWNKPKNEVAKATIVRAKAINESNGAASATSTQTYFVGDEFKGRYTLPVVSLVSDPNNLFGEETGIYVLGKSYSDHVDADITEDERQVFANYNQHGRAWERLISIEVFETGGAETYSQNGGVRIHGGGSRRYPQKTLRIYAGNEYDLREVFDYHFFSGKAELGVNQSAPIYKSFLLRNSGQDWLRSMFRDAFVQNLVGESRMDTQASRPAVVFLDGEYWGIYTLQERYDEYYLQNHYGIEPDQSVILRQSGVLFRGETGDEAHYSEMLRYIRENSLRQKQHYEYIKTQMDVDNYIDYLIAEIYAGNDDWPDNNIYLWRMKTGQYEPGAPYGQDGRWRWMLFDLDFGFGLKGGAEDYKLDTIEVAKQAGWSGFLFRSLIENEEFRTSFAKRFLEQIETTYAPDRVTAILDQMQADLRPEIEEHLQRWSSDPDALANWESEVDVMREFALKRPDAMREILIKQFEQDLKYK